MPRRDGTGPNGAGPMTGWRRGNCATQNKNPDQAELLKAKEIMLENELNLVRAAQEKATEKK